MTETEREKLVAKPLEWIEAKVSAELDRFTAHSILGQYEALKWSDGGYGGTFARGVEFSATSLGEAQAACQADYESRIRSALVDPDQAATISRLTAELARAREALELVVEEADAANTQIRMKRHASGQGRIRIATALHRIEASARAALLATSDEEGR